ncbi:MAG: D-aminoacyl-tRNA deacylase [Sphaerochaetaceae bacterium]|nr:D-aminoacyl-tRNA deacylase [Sphaerochaetaceae bacterium]
MKCVIQRVKDATVTVDEKIVGQIDHGLLVYFGVAKGDKAEYVDYVVNKISKLRMFRDENDKMNLSAFDVNAKILVVSQFTLYANLRKGNRPSYDNAEKPELAKKLYEDAVQKFKDLGFETQTGVFGAHMDVRYLNDGPVTMILEKID